MSGKLEQPFVFSTRDQVLNKKIVKELGVIIACAKAGGDFEAAESKARYASSPRFLVPLELFLTSGQSRTHGQGGRCRRQRCRLLRHQVRPPVPSRPHAI